MSNVAVVNDVLVRCPLLKKDIPDSLCYEINSVAFGFCKPELINDISIDFEAAEEVCEHCENLSV